MKTLRGFGRLLRRFSSARGGNVVFTFALALIPVAALTGAAVDYSRGNAVKADMQGALDATALMLGKDPSLGSMSSSQLQTKASNYFNALFTAPDAYNTLLAVPVIDNTASTVTVSASAKVKTSFMKLINVANLDISSSATVAWGTTRLRVALALDNTGSMASAGKMTALKTASHNLLTQLKNAASQNGDVYVSIIPFNKDVNVGKSNYSQTWVDLQDHALYEVGTRSTGLAAIRTFPSMRIASTRTRHGRRTATRPGTAA
jgi:Flp pilus assembly protein TadG